MENDGPEAPRGPRPGESSEGADGTGRPPRRKRRRRRRRPADGSTRTPGANKRKDGSPPDRASGATGRGDAGSEAKGRAAKGRAGGGGATAGGAKGREAKRGDAKGGGTKRGGAKRRRGSKREPHAPRIPTQREISAGGVVYRRTDEGMIEVVLASRRTRRGQLAWGLAKGGVEEGESNEAAAVREVREETGLHAVIEADLGDTKYMYVWEDVRIRKTVRFFLMRFTGGNVDERDDEMEEVRWFPLERALKRAAYRGERDMLAKAAELLR